jgi:hypothetical protein
MSNEVKQVHELTNDELRREIAEALGWREVTLKGQYLRGIHPGAGYELRVPEWATEFGAACGLCVKVLERLNRGINTAADPKAWYFGLELHRVCFERISGEGNVFVALGRDARALSELAALALREMGA